VGIFQFTFANSLVLFGVAMALASPHVSGQTIPWELFLDGNSESACDVINANNARLVVLSSTRQLAIVSGSDVTLEDTFVDENGFVSFEGEAAGIIDFAEDGDGLRTIWWMSLTGNVVSVNGFTGEPSPTNKLSTDFFDSPCDACPFWDDASVCDDSDPEDPVTVPLCGVDVPVPTVSAALVLFAVRFGRRREPPMIPPWKGGRRKDPVRKNRD